MRFYNHKSPVLYEIYLKLYESELEIEKKKLILKSLLAGEAWSWKITAISKQCLENFKKNKFEKSRKLKTSRKKVLNIVRHPHANFNETATNILNTRLSEKDWWEIIIKNEESHLITKDELKEEYYLFINIPVNGGYFLNTTSGYIFGEKEKLFLKHLNKSKIIWKRSNDTENL
ncbi:hypothetical protein OA253_02190 [Alphaproteobacteria bacterium]|nr:hypothetical protein [Alphaproteobacteria bacterium]